MVATAFWDGERRVFLLSASLPRHNAVVGLPWATNSVEHPAHQLGEAPGTMVILVDPERARGTLTRMAGDRLSSDWGAPMLSKESDLYDPLQPVRLMAP